MSRNINQDQRQDVRFDSVRPVVKVRCRYFTSDLIERIEYRLRSIGPSSSGFSGMTKDLEREQQVDVLVHQGVTTQVMCHFLTDGKCTSDKNEGKRCHLSKEV